MAPKTIPNRQIAEEAAEWAVRLDAAPLDQAERRLLAEWLTTSPAHVDELLISCSFLVGVQHLKREGAPSIEALLAQQAPEVVPLLGDGRSAQFPRTEGATRRAPARKLPERGMPIMAAAASLLLVLTATLAVLLTKLVPENLTSGEVVASSGNETGKRLVNTGLGEQRSIVLEDGSVVHLNTDTQLRVALSGSDRRIDLLRGEALFEVAHDQSRPFRVYAGRTLAQAVGTKFNVHRTRNGVSVAVVEGKVLVDNRRGRRILHAATGGNSRPLLANQGPVLLLAGDQADLTEASTVPTVRPTNIESVTSWRLRKIAFNDEGLDRVAQEFNRYNQRKILVADPAIGSRRLSGVFDADDPESFVAFLELSAGVEADRSKPERIVIRASH